MTIDAPATAGQDDDVPAPPPRHVLDASYTGFDKRHRESIRRFLRRLEADHAMVEDVLQEALLATREKWAYVRDYEKPEAWTIKVARNILSDHQRRRGRRGAVPLDQEPVHERPAPADAREAEELLGTWLRLLPRQQAEVLAMHHDGWQDREIAMVLGLADSTVRAYKAAARSRLEALATAAGFVVPAGRRRRR